MNRRHFLASSSAALLASAFSKISKAAADPPNRILLRSSWQIVNIGDIAHTPGLLALIEKHLPNTEVILWASPDLSDQVAAMEHKRFPKLKIVKGTISEDGKPSNHDLNDAVEWADFLLHGSGPSMVGHRDVAAFVKKTAKPFGVYAITYGGFGTAEKELLNFAKFVFFRDSISLAKAKTDGIKSPIMQFAPDAAFAFDIRNDPAATAFLEKHRLEEGKFLCCIPRLRYTPYWNIRKQTMTIESEKRHARNEAMKEHDHAPLREAIIAVTRQTPMKVLLCPEDQSQMAVGKEMLLDKLPDDVKPKVVHREKFWLTDEALSTYLKSAGLFGLEMHSPIMCIGHTIPALVGRFAEQTSKGLMWRDIGLEDWLFDFDNDADLKRLTPTVLSLLTDPAAAKAKAAAAQAFVRKAQAQTMSLVAQNLP
jgi:Polysaccharide pyruvyl transferase